MMQCTSLPFFCIRPFKAARYSTSIFQQLDRGCLKDENEDSPKKKNKSSLQCHHLCAFKEATLNEPDADHGPCPTLSPLAVDRNYIGLVSCHPPPNLISKVQHFPEKRADIVTDQLSATEKLSWKKSSISAKSSISLKTCIVGTSQRICDWSASSH